MLFFAEFVNLADGMVYAVHLPEIAAGNNEKTDEESYAHPDADHLQALCLLELQQPAPAAQILARSCLASVLRPSAGSLS